MERASLQALLEGYAPADHVQLVHKHRMQGLLAAAGDPFSRSHWLPGHFTAGGFVLSPERDRLLLIHHRKLDRWLQPGGHIDAADANVVAAAQREVREETGLTELSLDADGIFDLDIHPIPRLGTEDPHEHFDVRFLFRASASALVINSEVVSARWFALSEIAEASFDRSVARAVDRILRREPTTQPGSN